MVVGTFLYIHIPVLLLLFHFFFLNWDSLHVRLNSHDKAGSYKKKKHQMIKV